MKNTKVLLLGAVVATFTFTSLAVEPLLSPRAQGNQIKVARSSGENSATVAYVNSNSALLSPRAQNNQIKVVKGMNNDANPGSTCQKTRCSAQAMSECCDRTAMLTPALLSPRAQGNQAKTAKSMNHCASPGLTCQKTASCTSLAKPECSSSTTMSGCATAKGVETIE